MRSKRVAVKSHELFWPQSPGGEGDSAMPSKAGLQQPPFPWQRCLLVSEVLDRQNGSCKIASVLITVILVKFSKQRKNKIRCSQETQLAWISPSVASHLQKLPLYYASFSHSLLSPAWVLLFISVRVIAEFQLNHKDEWEQREKQQNQSRPAKVTIAHCRSHRR